MKWLKKEQRVGPIFVLNYWMDQKILLLLVVSNWVELLQKLSSRKKKYIKLCSVSMSKKNLVVSVFNIHHEAEQAIKELQNAGFDMVKLSIVGNDYMTDEHVNLSTMTATPGGGYTMDWMLLLL